jgi:hypothetical protein
MKNNVLGTLTAVIISICIVQIEIHTNISLLNASIISILIGIIFNVIISFILKQLNSKDM